MRVALVLVGGEQVHRVISVPTQLAADDQLLKKVRDLAEYYTQDVQEVGISLCNTLEEVEAVIREANNDSAESEE